LNKSKNKSLSESDLSDNDSSIHRKDNFDSDEEKKDSDVEMDTPNV
jgi:hypothetical protein